MWLQVITNKMFHFIFYLYRNCGNVTQQWSSSCFHNHIYPADATQSH